jgi:uncharacterized protein Usg
MMEHKMTDNAAIVSMEVETDPQTGHVFYTFPEHLYQLGENVCQALDIAKDFTDSTGLVPDIGSVSIDAALHTLSMMSYAMASSKGYNGTKEGYIILATAHYQPLLEQYIKHETVTLLVDEIEVTQ